MAQDKLTTEKLLNWDLPDLKTNYPLLYDIRIEIEEILNTEKSPYNEHRNINGSSINNVLGLFTLTIIPIIPIFITLIAITNDVEIPIFLDGFLFLILPVTSILLVSQLLFFASLLYLYRSNKEPEEIVYFFYLWSYTVDESEKKIYQPILFNVIFYLQNLYLNSLANSLRWNSVGFIKNIIERNQGYSVIKPNQTNIRVFNRPDNFKFFGTLFYAIKLIKKEPEIYSNPRKNGVTTTNLKLELAEILDLGETTIGDHIKKVVIHKKTALDLQMEGYEIVQISDKLKIIYDFANEHRKLSRLQSLLKRFRSTFIANIRA